MSDGSSGNLAAKIVGGVFAAIIAPILATIGANYVGALLPKPDDKPAVADAQADAKAGDAKQADAKPAEAKPADETTADAKATGAKAPDAKQVAAPAAGPADKPAASDPAPTALASATSERPAPTPPKSKPGPAQPKPNQSIRLFNGEDLKGFYTYFGPPSRGAEPLGKGANPDKNFDVRRGVLHISGRHVGGLVTEKEYENYHLTVVYRWGEKTWPPRENNARSGGVLLHCVGDDGSAAGVWMESIRCMIEEGRTGTLATVGSTPAHRISFNVTALKRVINKGDNRNVVYHFDPKAPVTMITAGVVTPMYQNYKWTDEKGFRGDNEVEKPHGNLNVLECICRDDTITILLNGETVNSISDLSIHKGKIMIQSLHAEMIVREINLQQF